MLARVCGFPVDGGKNFGKAEPLADSARIRRRRGSAVGPGDESRGAGFIGGIVWVAGGEELFLVADFDGEVGDDEEGGGGDVRSGSAKGDANDDENDGGVDGVAKPGVDAGGDEGGVGARLGSDLDGAADGAESDEEKEKSGGAEDIPEDRRDFAGEKKRGGRSEEKRLRQRRRGSRIGGSRRIDFGRWAWWFPGRIGV